MSRLGVSFSLHRCSELGIHKKQLLKAALQDLGFRRFRLMSYWNIHEQVRGTYDFSELDWQMDMVAKYGGEVTLCVGKRQPRWPECHLPTWARELPKEEWYAALFDYIEIVVNRYKDHPALASWQLENEALLKDFGYCVDNDYSHDRLRHELAIIKRLDPVHPVVMTLSDSWGLPWRRPRPDIYAMSLYRFTLNHRGEYVRSVRPPFFYRLRGGLIKLFWRRNVFIHELQAEPWLKKSLLEHSIDEQLAQLQPEDLATNISFAMRTGLRPVDLWGLEWWYWLKTHGQPAVWETVRKLTKA